MWVHVHARAMRGSRGKFGGPEPSPLLRWKIPVYSIYTYSKISENMSRRSSPRQLKYPLGPPPLIHLPWKNGSAHDII